MSTSFSPSAAVLVTGACGNLGRKIVEALARTEWCHRIVGVDLRADRAAFPGAALERLTLVEGDLTDPLGSWRDALAGIDAVVHFAALNPNVDATWAEAATSFDMTANLGLAALQHGVKRFVFASSNHVMGGYKDAPLAAAMGAGRLTTAIDPAPGTRWNDGTEIQDSTAYATAKLMGERFVTALAAQPGGRLTGVSVRIGWAQPGANQAKTISHAGSTLGGFPKAETDDAKRDLRWFRNMWLANADLEAIFLAAIHADPASWPTPAIVVNGMSGNRAMDWDIETARQWLGYVPAHDLYVELG